MFSDTLSNPFHKKPSQQQQMMMLELWEPSLRRFQMTTVEAKQPYAWDCIDFGDIRNNKRRQLTIETYCQSLCIWARWRSLLLNATWHELHIYGWDLVVFEVNAGCEPRGVALLVMRVAIAAMRNDGADLKRICSITMTLVGIVGVQRRAWNLES